MSPGRKAGMQKSVASPGEEFNNGKNGYPGPGKTAAGYTPQPFSELPTRSGNGRRDGDRDRNQKFSDVRTSAYHHGYRNGNHHSPVYSNRNHAVDHPHSRRPRTNTSHHRDFDVGPSRNGDRGHYNFSNGHHSRRRGSQEWHPKSCDRTPAAKRETFAPGELTRTSVVPNHTERPSVRADSFQYTSDSTRTARRTSRGSNNERRSSNIRKPGPRSPTVQVERPSMAGSCPMTSYEEQYDDESQRTSEADHSVYFINPEGSHSYASLDTMESLRRYMPSIDKTAIPMPKDVVSDETVPPIATDVVEENREYTSYPNTCESAHVLPHPYMEPTNIQQKEQRVPQRMAMQGASYTQCPDYRATYFRCLNAFHSLLYACVTYQQDCLRNNRPINTSHISLALAWIDYHMQGLFYTMQMSPQSDCALTSLLQYEAFLTQALRVSSVPVPLRLAMLAVPYATVEQAAAQSTHWLSQEVY